MQNAECYEHAEYCRRPNEDHCRRFCSRCRADRSSLDAYRRIAVVRVAHDGGRAVAVTFVAVVQSHVAHR